jgi:dipeptidyl aminopeptidase/acylaminoacyl peptidase
MQLYLRALAAILVLLASARAVEAAVPLEAFVAPPKIVTPVISPSGRYLAFAKNDTSATVVAVIDLDAPGTPPAGLTMPAGSGAAWIMWKGDNRVVAMLYPAKEFKLGQGERLVLPTNPRIVAFDKDGKNFKTIWQRVAPDGLQQILRTPLEDPDHVLIGMYDPAGRTDLHRMNVHTGDTQKIETGNKYTAYWLVDMKGRPKARIEAKYNRIEMWVRRGETDDWERIASYNERGAPRMKIFGFSNDPTIAIVGDRAGSDRFGLYEYHLPSRMLGRKLLDHPNVDVGWPVGELVYEPHTGALVGACFAEDVWFCRYFDPALTAAQQKLEATFADSAIVRLSTWSTDRKRFVVWVSGPKNPGAYFLYDVAKGAATSIGKIAPQLSENELGDMLVIKYKARDGTKITGYLTMPPGKGDKNLPLVVMPHGGPELRDIVSFDPWAQMLANRGYAVLQPNFRGSGGYGKRFTEAGHRQWGRLMQDDITDGVKALIKDGTVNANRICIVGASYGGYAALAGGAFTPELYKCVMSIAGVADVAEMMEYEKNLLDEELYKYWTNWVGDPRVDMEQIKSISPINHVSKFAAPVLLMHGEHDRIVKPGQSMLMSRALKNAGKQVEFIQVEGEGHSFYLEKNRLRLLKEMERFVTTHIGR